MAEICDQVPDKQIIKALKVFRDLDAKKDKMSLMSSNDIRLSFSFFKLPSQASKNSKMLKIALPHPLGFEDVCLFVGDGPEAKDDRTKMDDVCQLYENKLAKLGITQVKEIIPMLKLKLEYQTYEARRALASRYDCFLADDKIMRLLPSLLGKSFFQQNKFPLQVRLRESCMERELKKALHTVTCPITYKGNSYSVVVGNLEMKDEELAQNIRSAMLKIAENGLGGPQNIQKFHLNLNNLPSLPVFVSNVDRSAVPIPMPHKQSVSKPTPKVEEVSTIDGKVKIGEDGTVSIYQKNGKVSHIIGGGQDSKKVKRLKKGAKPLKTDGRTKQRKVAKGAASPSQAKQVKTALKPADSDSPLNAESKQKKSATPKASDTVVLPKSAKKLNSNAGSPSVEVEKDAAKASKASPLAQKVTASELVEGDAEMSIKASPVLNASGVSKSTPKPKSAKKIKPTTASKLKPVSSNADANSATPKSIVTSADEVTKLSKSTPKPAKTPKSAITPKGVSSPKTEDMKQVKTALKQAASDSPLNAESKQKKSATPKASETVVAPKSAKKLNSNAGSSSVEVEKDAAKASKASPLAQKVTASELVGDAEMSIKASPALNASGVSKSTPKPKSAKKLKPALSNANSATPKSIVTSADEVTKLSMSTSKPAKTPKSAITPKGVSSPKTEGMELATPKLAKTGDGNSPGLPVKELKKSGKKTCDSSKNGSEKENNVESTSSVVVVNKRKSVDAGVKDDGASEITSVKKARKSALATPKVSQNGGKEVAPKSVKASPVVPMITPPGAKRVLRSKSRNTAKKASPKSA